MQDNNISQRIVMRNEKMRLDHRFRLFFVLPSLFMIVPLCFLSFWYAGGKVVGFFRSWDAPYEEQKTYFISYKIKSKKIVDIQTLVQEGIVDVESGYLDDAQRKFNYILEHDEYNYWANYGTAKLMTKRCKREGQYCDLAKQYISYTQYLSSIHRQELRQMRYGIISS